MSIVDNGNDVHVEYQIPDEIQSKIPQHFYSALAGELCSVFGRMIFDKDESGVYGISYIGGTTGWMEALKMTSEKLDMAWLLDYYKSLPWHDSDIFDGEIEDKIISEFIEADQKPESTNAYYEFLLQRKTV